MKIINFSLFLCLASSVFARPSILVYDVTQSKVDTANSKSSLAAHLSQAFKDTGKFNSDYFTPTSPNGGLDLSTDAALLTFAREGRYEYVLTIQPAQEGEILNIKARLIKVNGEKEIWKMERGFKISIEETISHDMTFDTAARSIAMNIASDPLKNIPLSTATSEDPKVILPKANVRPDAVAPDQSPFRAGIQALQEDRGMDAISFFREVIDTDPMNSQARAELIHAYLLAEKSESSVGKMNAIALETAKRSMKLIPNSLELQHAYIDVLSATESTASAEESLRTLLNTNPNDGSILSSLSQILIKEEKLSEGIDFAEKAAVLNPNNSAPQKTLSVAYLLNEQFDKALIAWNATHTLDPNEPIKSYEARQYNEIENIIRILDSFSTRIGALNKDVVDNNADVNSLKQRTQSLTAKLSDLSDMLDKLEFSNQFDSVKQYAQLSVQQLKQALEAVTSFLKDQKPSALEDSALFRSDALQSLQSSKKALASIRTSKTNKREPNN